MEEKKKNTHVNSHEKLKQHSASKERGRKKEKKMMLGVLEGDIFPDLRMLIMWREEERGQQPDTA